MSETFCHHDCWSATKVDLIEASIVVLRLMLTARRGRLSTTAVSWLGGPTYGICSTRCRMPRNRSQLREAPAATSPRYSNDQGIGTPVETTWMVSKVPSSSLTSHSQSPS